MWATRDPVAWARSAEGYRLLGDALIKLGEPLMAFDVIAEGLGHFPADLRLRQLHAFALARSGATERANRLLTALRTEGHDDDETLGLLGRTHKDLAARAGDPVERERQLRFAFDAYATAYRATKAIWPGINAATTAVLAGDKTTAAALARELDARGREAVRRPQTPGEDYWLFATLGEAALILGETEEAASWYAQAVGVAGNRFGDIASTRRNARLLLDHLGGEPRLIERALRVPSVMVFCGHMIDRPDRVVPRFPPELERAVGEALRERIRAAGSRFAFASAAGGGDLLFLEAMLDAGGEAHVVLPYEREPFVRESVDLVPGADWPARFDRVLGRAVEVVIASGHGMPGGVTYEYANLLLFGLAAIRAAQLDTELVPVAVWDGRAGDGPGGTAVIVAWWRSLGHRVEVIDLAALLAREAPGKRCGAVPASAAPATAGTPATPIVSMLFADAVHFSKLTDRQIPRFVDDFLGAVADLVASSPHAPVMTNTWGDGLYFVFEDVADAGLFALDLCDRINDTRWSERALPETLNLRIALHTGPVYAITDPVTRRPNFIGVHVSRAARIEPITPPGQVYASEAFAAVAAARTAAGFTCDYVGQTPLAKGFGTFPTYHLRRA